MAGRTWNCEKLFLPWWRDRFENARRWINKPFHGASSSRVASPDRSVGQTQRHRGREPDQSDSTGARGASRIPDGGAGKNPAARLDASCRNRQPDQAGSCSGSPALPVDSGRMGDDCWVSSHPHRLIMHFRGVFFDAAMRGRAGDDGVVAPGVC